MLCICWWHFHFVATLWKFITFSAQSFSKATPSVAFTDCLLMLLSSLFTLRSYEAKRGEQTEGTVFLSVCQTVSLSLHSSKFSVRLLKTSRVRHFALEFLLSAKIWKRQTDRLSASLCQVASTKIRVNLLLAERSLIQK